MDSSTTSVAFLLTIVGFGTGIALLIRGFISYRAAGRIGDTATSRVATLAAGEVRVTGVIEPAELTLISLLQSEPCVYFRSAVGGDDGLGDALGDDGHVLEERAVGFAVRDASGTIRVFPHDARVEAPVRWEDRTGMLGDEPPGLRWRLGSAFGPNEGDREAAAAALLEIHDPVADPSLTPAGRLDAGSRRRTYRESRLEPGDQVTILGQALPFSDLAHPAEADVGGTADPSADGGDPEIAADLAAARAAGTLLTDPDAAWGNAAIPGFGIGRPVRPATIDPAATPLRPAGPEAAARAKRTFTIAPETLVLASIDDAPLLVTYGSPVAVVERERWRFVQGLLGGALAIGALAIAALLVTGSAR